jgi:hypothetical protein
VKVDASGRDRRLLAPMLAAAAMFLLVYGSELGSFSLSVDEEVASFVGGLASSWLEQGRWGMALVSLLLPDFEAIPLLSTLLFGLGLLAATRRALHDFRLQGSAAWLFAVVHVGFPLWLHIAEFNTLAAGVGIGLAAAAYGAGLLQRAGWPSRLAGVLLLTFAVATYQTLLLYSSLYIVLLLNAQWRAQPEGWGARLRMAIPLLLGQAAALLLYWLVLKAAMFATGAQTAYVDGYLHLAQLHAQPLRGLRRALRYTLQLLLGGHAIYLGWGWAILALSWIGAWPWRARPDGAANAVASDRARKLLVALAALLLVALPALPSLGLLPARAYVAWPLLAAWLAARAGPLFDRARPALLALALGYFALVATSIGAACFHADRLVYSADAALARELGVAIEGAAGTARPIRFSLAGERRFPFGGQVQRAEMFGNSFFERDGGNVHRVALLMRLQGTPAMEGVWLSSRPGLVAAATAMPAWPKEGSVRMVDGVVLVKLGEPTALQLAPP